MYLQAISLIKDFVVLGAQAMEIERILAASLDEEKRMKDFQMTQLKQSWAESAAKKQAEKQQPATNDFDPDNCGPSSLQCMNGEDRDRLERLKNQKDQMRTWIQQQIAEKNYVKVKFNAKIN